jgi:hypothetical protein
MSTMLYPASLVWFGIWKTPSGLVINGFHVWNNRGGWHGVYNTCGRATAEAFRVKEI